MRLGDYLRGIRLTMTSPLPPHELERRINEATVSRFLPFSKGVSGWARFSRLRLRHRRRMRNDGQAVLAGRITEGNRGSHLDLRYGAPLPILVFFAFWYAILLGLVLPFLLFGPESTTSSPADTWLITAFIAFFGIFPLALLFFFRMSADDDLAALVAFLEREVQAQSAGRLPG